VGNKYIIKAQPLPGSVFTNWTSNLLPPTNAETLTFTMVSNLVLYANFLDVSTPTVSLNSPVGGQVVTNTPLTLRGVATDSVAVAQVWYAVNTNAWQLAAGTTNWSGSVALEPGTNVLRAYALNVGNNASPTNTVRILYAAPTALTLRTNGLGTITNPGGNTFLAGQTYTLTAVPAAGFTFTNWTSNLGPGTNKTTVKFTMVPNLVLTANFVDSQSPTLTIASPGNQRFTNSQATVTGTAADNWGVGGVWCQLNGGAWSPADTANGYANWSWSLALVPGTNVINAYAVDLAALATNGLARYSRTSSVTVFFLTAPYNLVNCRAAITPADGTPPFELDFGSNTFSQYSWGTNQDNGAGTYAYANPGLATGVLTLQSFALPENAFAQTWQLDFTNRYVAGFTYTNGDGQTVGATATFTLTTNVAPATVSGQTLVSVNALGSVETLNLLTNGHAVQITGTRRQTNTWAYQTYGPCGAVLVLADGGQTNWNLFHYEAVHAAEYCAQNSAGMLDAGLMGFARPSTTGVAPQPGSLTGQVLLANSDATLTTVALTATQFVLTTSDDSQTGTGTYNYSLVNSNVGRFVLNYGGAETPTAVTNVILFYNPNFGVATNAAGVSGLILY
jgi:hypothetical protein